MRENVAKFFLALLFIGLVAAYFGIAPYQGGFLDIGGWTLDGNSDDRNSNDGDSDDSDSDGEHSFPKTSGMRLRNESYFLTNFGEVDDKEVTYELVIDEEAGIPDQKWFEDTWKQALKYDEESDEPGVKHNEYLRDAMDNRNVVYWQETGKDDYDDGRKVIIIYMDQDDNVVAKKLKSSITTIDFDDNKEPSDVFKDIEKTIPESEVKAERQSLVDEVKGMIADALGNKTSEAPPAQQPPAEQPALEQPPAEQPPAEQPVVGSYQRIRSGTNTVETTDSGKTGSYQRTR